MNVDNKIILQILGNYAEVASIVKVEVTPSKAVEVCVVNASGEIRRDVWSDSGIFNGVNNRPLYLT